MKFLHKQDVTFKRKKLLSIQTVNSLIHENRTKITDYYLEKLNEYLTFKKLARLIFFTAIASRVLG